jgi:small-conductance mechanosensitive channel
VRRLNIDLVVTYDMDIGRVRDVLLDIAAKTRNALKNPEPLFMVKNFGESGIALFFGVWFATDEWFDGNNEMHVSIQKRFEAEGISFAYPTMTIYQKK